MLEVESGEQSIDATFKSPVKSKHRRRRSDFDQYEALKPWNVKEDNFDGYIIRKRLYAERPINRRLDKIPVTKSFVWNSSRVPTTNHAQHRHSDVKANPEFHLPALVSIEVPKDKKKHSRSVQLETPKRSISLPLIRKPKRSLFQQKRSLGLGDLRQQQIKQLKDCINSQILCMEDFQSLKSRILKI